MAKKSIPAGSLCHKLTLQERSAPAVDAHGHDDVTFANVVELWGNVNPMRGRELSEARQTQGQVTHRVLVRYRNDLATITIDHDSEINERYRLLFGARVFNIATKPINIEERNRWLQMDCIERTPADAN